jgi:hypothetical protein
VTEAEWLAQCDPLPMLKFVQTRASGRQLRLFACACCRRVLHLLPDQRSRKALDVAELFADGRVEEPERQKASDILRGVRHDHVKWALVPDAIVAALESMRYAVWTARSATKAARRQDVRRSEGKAQAELLRDIFGNPIRPVALDPAWRTFDVVALAQGIYTDRAFDRMPILADALQDAGCTNEDVLNHCRDADRIHVRGCRVVDLVLDKA